MNFVNLFGVPISITSKLQAIALVGEWVREWREGKGRRTKLIFTPNPEMIVAAQSDPEFLKTLQGADLAIPDGVGVVWALRLSSRVSGIDLMAGRIFQGGSFKAPTL